MIKRFYVTCVRGLRVLSGKTGLLAFLESNAQENRTALWLRSLFAIYDIEDMAKLDLPWWNLAAVDAADNFLRNNRAAKVFEYGSGASTIWLARRAASVTSIEHDRAWYEVVLKRLSGFDNAILKLIEPDTKLAAGYLSEKEGWAGRSFQEYASSIDAESDQFDLIIIDGRARGACLEHARKRLAPGGMILFDNSGRKRYRDPIAACGMRARILRGRTACLPYPDETTLLTAF